MGKGGWWRGEAEARRWCDWERSSTEDSKPGIDAEVEVGVSLMRIKV